MKKMMILAAAVALTAYACDNDDDNVDDLIDPAVYIYDFDNNAEGWQGNYSDYPVDGESLLGLEFGQAELPEALEVDEGALMISGSTGEDSPFLYTKTKITDLEPNTTYNVSFKVRFAATVDTVGATWVDDNLDLYVKAGVSLDEPVTQADNQGYVRFTGFDKGLLGQPGADVVILSSFNEDDLWADWLQETVSNNENPMQFTTDASGEAWVVVGTETDGGGKTIVYYDNIEVDFD